MIKKGNKQELFWKKVYGEKYISKNSKFSNKEGVKAWNKMLLKVSNLNSILECGSNIGRHIGYLEKIYPKSKKSIIEINKKAIEINLKKNKIFRYQNNSIINSSFDEKYNLVFTMGVLIHIHPSELKKNLKKIISFSNKYILIGEYFSKKPTSINYQNEKDLLFKRDFGKYIIHNFNLKLIDYGFLWSHEFASFDDINYWLFKTK